MIRFDLTLQIWKMKDVGKFLVPMSVKPKEKTVKDM